MGKRKFRITPSAEEEEEEEEEEGLLTSNE